MGASPTRTVDVDRRDVIIGDGASIDGQLRCEGTIFVRGHVKGEIESKHGVVIEAGANVEAQVAGEYVTVHGEMSGSIDSIGRVEMAPGSRVTGDVTAGSLSIEDGAVFEGNVRLTNRGIAAD
jgi:cytoskeletal protein CcmA (bactofilin family)